jgi:antitoxin YefM
MRAKSVSEFRKNIAADLDQVVDDHVPLIVTRNGKKSAVVVISLEDYTALDETAYLLASPENARQLRAAVAELNEGRVVPFQLPE